MARTREREREPFLRLLRPELFNSLINSQRRARARVDPLKLGSVLKRSGTRRESAIVPKIYCRVSLVALRRRGRRGGKTREWIKRRRRKRRKGIQKDEKWPREATGFINFPRVTNPARKPFNRTRCFAKFRDLVVISSRVTTRIISARSVDTGASVTPETTSRPVSFDFLTSLWNCSERFSIGMILFFPNFLPKQSLDKIIIVSISGTFLNKSKIAVQIFEQVAIVISYSTQKCSETYVGIMYKAILSRENWKLSKKGSILSPVLPFGT